MAYGKRPPLDEQKSLWEASLAREGVTTGAGAATGDSFIDAGLIGVGANSFVSMLAIIYPGQPTNVDSMDITAFNNATGEVTLAKAYKGVAAAIPAGVPYKIVTFRFVPAEVAAIEAKLDHAGHGLAALKTLLDSILEDTGTTLEAKLDAIGGIVASILEDTGTDLEAKLDALYPYHGLVYYGLVTGIDGAPNFQCSGLVGFGNDFFNGYWAYVVWDAGGGAAPQGEMLQCTGYLTATGDFTVAAFGGGGIAVEDKVLLLHPAIASLINTTHGLAALKTLIDAVEAKLDAGGLADPKVMGRLQVAATTIDLQQAAGDHDLFTGTTQDVVVEKLLIRLPNVDCSDDVTITSISIQTDDVTEQVFISAANGAVVNLTAEAQLGYTGVVMIKAGTKIQLTIAGGAADAPTVCDVIAEYRAVIAGGYLAP